MITISEILQRKADAQSAKMVDQAAAFEDLYEDVLRAIADGHDDPVLLARTALPTEEQMNRWRGDQGTGPSDG